MVHFTRGVGPGFGKEVQTDLTHFKIAFDKVAEDAIAHFKRVVVVKKCGTSHTNPSELELVFRVQNRVNHEGAASATRKKDVDVGAIIGDRDLVFSSDVLIHQLAAITWLCSINDSTIFSIDLEPDGTGIDLNGDGELASGTGCIISNLVGGGNTQDARVRRKGDLAGLVQCHGHPGRTFKLNSVRQRIKVEELGIAVSERPGVESKASRNCNGTEVDLKDDRTKVTRLVVSVILRAHALTNQSRE